MTLRRNVSVPQLSYSCYRKVVSTKGTTHETEKVICKSLIAMQIPTILLHTANCLAAHLIPESGCLVHSFTLSFINSVLNFSINLIPQYIVFFVSGVITLPPSEIVVRVTCPRVRVCV